MTKTQIRGWNTVLELSEVFDGMRAQAVAEHEGEWILMAADHEVVGYYPAEMEAVRAGHRHGRGAPFLVKQVLEVDRTISVSPVLLDFHG